METPASYLKSISTPPPVTTVPSFDVYVPDGRHALLAAIYLIRRHPSDCLIVSAIKAILPHPTADVDYQDAGLIWGPGERSRFYLSYPDTRKSYIKACRACKKKARFIVTISTLTSGNDDGHANMLIYDTKVCQLERFDPYHKSPTRYDPVGLDNQLASLYRHIDDDFEGLVTPPGHQFIMDKGFQGLLAGLGIKSSKPWSIQRTQELERKYNRKLDPIGYCQPWSMLYTDLRLSFPDLKPSEIMQVLRSKARLHSYTEFIRRYAQFLQSGHEDSIKALRRYRQTHKGTSLSYVYLKNFQDNINAYG